MSLSDQYFLEMREISAVNRSDNRNSSFVLLPSLFHVDLMVLIKIRERFLKFFNQFGFQHSRLHFESLRLGAVKQAKTLTMGIHHVPSYCVVREIVSLAVFS